MSYEDESKINNAKMSELFKAIFPDIPVPYEYMYDLLQYLSTTKVNAGILPRVIRGIHNIEIGTGKGQVVVHVQRDVMNVSVRETDEEMKVRE